jgi:hypothetical protein
MVVGMNNPPAFPVFPETSGGHAAAFQGMTLRDYMAAKAMQGFMANKSNPMRFQPEDDANWAYSIADAMLAAREKV